MKSLVVSFLCAVLLVLIFIFRQDFVVFLNSFSDSWQGVVGRGRFYEDIGFLKSENLALKSEVAMLKKNIVFGERFGFDEAVVSSRYPFADRGLLTINLGSRDGLRVGMPVLVQEGILLGRLSEVRRTQSEVLTIFDPTWRSSVAVGEKRIKALLKGGPKPILEFIPQEALLEENDAVFNISPEFPFDLTLARIGSVEKTANSVWLNAGLEFSYQPEALEQVLVVFDFP